MTTSRTGQFFVSICWISWLLAQFWSSKTDQIRVCRLVLENTGNEWLAFLYIYPEQLHNLSTVCLGVLIFLILAQFWLSETGHIWGFGHYLENAGEKWPKLGFHMFPNSFQNGLDFNHARLETHRSNGLTFSVLMYPGHLWDLINL